MNTDSTSDSTRCYYPGTDTVYCPECGNSLEYVLRLEGTVDRARCPHCENEITHIE